MPGRRVPDLPRLKRVVAEPPLCTAGGSRSSPAGGHGPWRFASAARRALSPPPPPVSRGRRKSAPLAWSDRFSRHVRVASQRLTPIDTADAKGRISEPHRLRRTRSQFPALTPRRADARRGRAESLDNLAAPSPTERTAETTFTSSGAGRGAHHAHRDFRPLQARPRRTLRSWPARGRRAAERPRCRA